MTSKIPEYQTTKAVKTPDHRNNCIGIIGTGMIGCSIACALQKYQPDNNRKIIGYSAGKSAQLAKELNFIDEISPSVDAIFSRCNLIIIATPLLAMENIISHSPLPEDWQLVIDVGSVKQSVIEKARVHWGTAVKSFIPCHPLAGSEHSGPRGANADLYQSARVAITPLEENEATKIKQAENFWLNIGATIHHLSPADHDHFLSSVSHMPHLLSFALVEGLARRHGNACFEWAAGGFRDFTRIAHSDSNMWADICLSNQIAISESLSNYIDDLQKIHLAITQANREDIENTFKTAKNALESFHKQKI